MHVHSIVSNTVSSRIPFLDLVAPHAELEEQLTDVFRGVLRTAGFVGGPAVAEFENAFAGFCGSGHCVAVGSGTDALRFALVAAGVRPGDAVLTVPNTFIATSEAITQAGALPEFVDVEEDTCNLSVEMLRKYLERHCARDGSGRPVSRRSGRPVTAVVPVHLYGQMADMDPILELAEEHGLLVIEDACQAHGAEYYSAKSNRWMRAGTVGQAAAFSFYPGKNLGACGEAGAVTTNDEAIAATVKMLRDHGQDRKYHHQLEGYNGRLDALQAGLLNVKLPHLEEWNMLRRGHASGYNRLLNGDDSIRFPYEPSWSRAVYHLYVIRTEARDLMIRHLDERGIGTGIHYPVPLHLQPAYASLNYAPGDFPAAERAASEVISLPMFPQLMADQQVRVAEAIRGFSAADGGLRRKTEESVLDPAVSVP
jgi:dTDP-4-amino-4,6-dideoxygalactose transaminase